MSTPEHSDRAKYVTEQVALWIVNDGDYYDRAGHYAQDAQPDRLRRYLLEILQNDRESAAPWHVAQELAPNDYARIDWEYVAEQLRGE